jgi:fatty acid synthase subunit alpha, fungi type
MPYSCLLGKQPIMVASMMLSTVKGGFVSAILSTGFHFKWASSDHYSPAAIRAEVAEIQLKIPPGIGLTLNLLYFSQWEVTFQLSLWQEMRKRGLPIEGFFITVGIPSTEKAAEIIEGLRNAGIKHIAFKPSLVEGI